MAPPNPLGEQIIGKEAIFGDFGAFFRSQNAPTINQKARNKHMEKTTHFRSRLWSDWGVFGRVFFIKFSHFFRVPKANERQIGREAIHTVKTILLSRSDLP